MTSYAYDFQGWFQMVAWCKRNPGTWVRSEEVSDPELASDIDEGGGWFRICRKGDYDQPNRPCSCHFPELEERPMTWEEFMLHLEAHPGEWEQFVYSREEYRLTIKDDGSKMIEIRQRAA